MADIPDDLTTTATISVGGTFHGTLEELGDRDWVAVTLVAGQAYTIALNGTGAGEIADPFLRLYDAAGFLITSDDDSGPGLSSLVTYVAPRSGIFYIEAGAFDGAGAGTYTITVDETRPPSFLDSVDWGTKVAPGVIDVYFAQGGDVINGRASLGWNAYEIQQAMLAFQQFSNVCNVSFNITTDKRAADFRLVTTESNKFLGFFGPPDTGKGSGVGVFANNGAGWDEADGGGLEQGGYGFVTLIHEFGHGLGMAHPHDDGGTSTIWEGVTDPFDSFGTFDLNQGVYTMMSYNDGWQLNPDGLPTDFLGGYEGTLMAFDVALMQQKYGANTSFHNKADTYVLSDANGTGAYYSCLWDTGGTDRILYQGASDATIDLRAAHLGYAAGSGGYISFADGIFGGFTIAHDVVIENARGGSGRDRIIGNDARNFLNGGAGDDTIMGGLGGDTLKGGGGADTFVYVSAEDSSARAQARDQIIGFQTGLDKIDLAAIDARTGGTDNDTFLWIGHRGFHEIAGELRWKAIADGILVVADRDGDGRADFSILLAGLTSIAEVDFLL